MEFLNLGRSGLQVSAIAYGYWLTHGAPTEAEPATACGQDAPLGGTTPFHPADAHSGTHTARRPGPAPHRRRRDASRPPPAVPCPPSVPPSREGWFRLLVAAVAWPAMARRCCAANCTGTCGDLSSSGYGITWAT